MIYRKLVNTILLVMIVFLAGHLNGQNKIKSFKSFNQKGMTVVNSLFPIYRDSVGNVYMEITKDMINRDIEIRAQINRGFNMIARPIHSMGVVSLLKYKDNIVFQKKILSERILDDDTDVYNSFNLSNNQPINNYYKIEAYSENKRGYIINITKFLKRTDDWFKVDYSSVKMLNSEFSEIKDISSFNKGVYISVSRMYGYNKNISNIELITPSSYMPLEIGCVISLLDNKAKNKLRLACDNISYQADKFLDYSQNPNAVIQDSIIRRWFFDISHKNKKVGLSKPSNSLCFYVDSLFPKKLIPYIKMAIKDWNHVFERVGMKDVLEMKISDKSTILAEKRAVISYDMGDNKVSSNITYNEMNGEILSCRINFGHGILADEIKKYAIQCGNQDSRVKKNLFNDKIIGNIFYSLLLKEIGNVLGLKKNNNSYYHSLYMNKYCYFHSVMDNNPYNYCIREGRVNYENLVPRIGKIDEIAIEYGYMMIDNAKSPYADREIAKKNIESEYIKFDTSPFEAIYAIENGIKNLIDFYKDIDVFVKNNYDDYMRYLPVYIDMAKKTYFEYLLNITKILSADNEKVFDYAKYHHAIKILDKYLFAGGVFLHNNFIDSKMFVKPGQKMIKCAKNIADLLVSRKTIEMLINNNKYNVEYRKYMIEDLFNDINNFIFNKKTDNFYRRLDVQSQFLHRFIILADKDNVFQNMDMYSIVISEEIIKLYNIFNSVTITSKYYRLHKIFAKRIFDKFGQYIH